MSLISYILAFVLAIVAPGRYNPVMERPVVNIPAAERQENWGKGSCVWATMVSLLKWEGNEQLAATVRESCSGGASINDVSAKFDRLGIPYAYSTGNDVAFLEWSLRTRRGVGVVVPGRRGLHFIALVGLSSKTATLLDNNSVENLIEMPREEFLSTWKKAGGWAIAVVYSPPAPLLK